MQQHVGRWRVIRSQESLDVCGLFCSQTWWRPRHQQEQLWNPQHTMCDAHTTHEWPSCCRACAPNTLSSVAPSHTTPPHNHTTRTPHTRMTAAPSSSGGSRGPPPPAAAASAAAGNNTGCCSHCGVPGVLPEWLERLRVSVCSGCSKRHERFISKSNAKALYLLSDGDLAPLGYLEKANPHHAKFALMRQYLVTQVEAVAVQKHGSLEALEEEKQRRMRDKLDKRLTKRKAAEESAARQAAHEAALAAAVERYTSTTHQDDGSGGQGATEPEDVVDASTGKRLRRFAEGLAAAEVEEF